MNSGYPCGARTIGRTVDLQIAGSIGLWPQQNESSPSKKTLPAPVNESDNRETSIATFSLLREAYNTSRHLPTEQRIPLMSELYYLR